ncbi:TPA: hypothetical protein N0F65_005028, partial [Lagenidium giganteum]
MLWFVVADVSLSMLKVFYCRDFTDEAQDKNRDRHTTTSRTKTSAAAEDHAPVHVGGRGSQDQGHE